MGFAQTHALTGAPRFARRARGFGCRGFADAYSGGAFCFSQSKINLQISCQGLCKE